VNIVLALVLKEDHVHLPGATCNADHSSGDGGGCSAGCSHNPGGGFEFSSPRFGTSASTTTSIDDSDNESGDDYRTRNNSKSIEMMSIDLMNCQPCVPLPSPDGEPQTTTISSQPGISKSTTFVKQFDFIPKRQPKEPQYEPIDVDVDTVLDIESSINDDDSGDVEAQSLATKTSPPPEDPAETTQNRIGVNMNMNVNLSAAYLHALTDLIQSVLVLITGIVIWYKPHWHWLDPLLTVCFSIMVLLSSRPIFKRAILVLLDTCPFDSNDDATTTTGTKTTGTTNEGGRDYDKVKTVIHRVASLFSSSTTAVKVCCLRIWSVSDGRIGLTCHINRKNSTSMSNSATTTTGALQQRSSNTNTMNTNNGVILRDIVRTLEREFGIDGRYTTIQIVDSNISSRCAACGI